MRTIVGLSLSFMAPAFILPAYMLYHAHQAAFRKNNLTQTIAPTD